MNQLQPDNRFPDCVFMKMHSAPTALEEAKTTPLIVSSVSTLSKEEDKTVDLKLTIRFGKDTIKYPGGQVQFGVRRGKLKLELENGKIPLEKMGLVTPFQTTVEIEEQQERGREAEANLAVAAGLKNRDIQKNSSKAKHTAYRIANQGTEENPIWEFQAERSLDDILSGQLTGALLGNVEVNGRPCNVKATFEVQEQTDVCLFDAQGLLKAKNLSRNKTALLTREFFLRFIAPRLRPYLSQVEGEL